jgi:hypothetical protein
MASDKRDSLHTLYRDAPNGKLRNWLRRQLLASRRRITKRRATTKPERFEPWIAKVRAEGIRHICALEANITSTLKSLSITPFEADHSVALDAIVDITLMMHKWTTTILSNPDDKTIIQGVIADDITSLLTVARELGERLAPGTENIIRSCFHDPMVPDSGTLALWQAPHAWPVLLLPNCGEKEKHIDFTVPALANLVREVPPGMTLMSTSSSYEPAGSILSIDANLSEVHWAMFSWTLATYVDHYKLIQKDGQTQNYMQKWLYMMTSCSLVPSNISVFLQTIMGAAAAIAANSKPYAHMVSRQYELDDCVALSAMRHRAAESGAFQSVTAALRGSQVTEWCLLACAVIAAIGHDYSEMRGDYANGEHANICLLLMRYNGWTYNHLKAWYFSHFSRLYLGTNTSRRIAIVSAG